MLPTQINSPLIQFLLCAAQTVQSRHRDAVLQFARCSEAVILWQSSRLLYRGWCRWHAERAFTRAGTPDEGRILHLFPFLPEPPTLDKKKYQKIVPGAVDNEKEDLYETYSYTRGEKISFDNREQKGQPVFFANLLFIKCSRCFQFFPPNIQTTLLLLDTPSKFSCYP